VVPNGIDAEAGEAAIVTSTAGVTCTAVFPVMPSCAALMVALPTVAALASPPAVTPATAALLELHVTVAVIFPVVPSEYVADAESCCEVPLARESGDGLTAIETITAGVTVNTVLPLTPADVAEIVVVPTVNDVARPREPAVMLTVATVAFDDAHVTLSVMSSMLPSVKVPVAANGCVPPSGTDGIAGVTAIVTKVAAVTVRLVEPTIAPDVARIVVIPVAWLVASPAVLTVATDVSDEVQPTDAVRFCVLPSVYVAVAAYCCVVPSGIDVSTGVTAIETSAAGSTVAVV